MKLQIVLVLLVLTAQAFASGVDVAWTASVTPGVKYSVYRLPPGGTTFVRRVSGVQGTLWTDTTTQPNKTYSYLVRSVTAQQVESVDSNITTITVGSQGNIFVRVVKHVGGWIKHTVVGQ